MAFSSTRKAAPFERRLYVQNLILVTVATATAATITATTTTVAATATAAATAISTTATAAAARSATAPTTALFTRAGDVHCEGAIIQLGAIQAFHSFLRFLFGGHRNETETAGAAGHTISHKIGFQNCAVLGKSILKLVFGDVEGKISDKQFVIHSVMSEVIP
jgi:hypothetical protein